MLLFGKISSTELEDVRVARLVFVSALSTSCFKSLRQLFVTFDSTTVNRFNFFGVFLGRIFNSYTLGRLFYPQLAPFLRIYARQRCESTRHLLANKFQ